MRSPTRHTFSATRATRAGQQTDTSARTRWTPSRRSQSPRPRRPSPNHVKPDGRVQHTITLTKTGAPTTLRPHRLVHRQPGASSTARPWTTTASPATPRPPAARSPGPPRSLFGETNSETYQVTGDDLLHTRSFSSPPSAAATPDMLAPVGQRGRCALRHPGRPRAGRRSRGELTSRSAAIRRLRRPERWRCAGRRHAPVEPQVGSARKTIHALLRHRA
jgi:hypothetical protein